MQETYHGEVEREQATQAYEGAAAPAQAVGDLIPDSQSGPPQQASRQHFMVGRSRVMSCVCQGFGRPFESSGVQTTVRVSAFFVFLCEFHVVFGSCCVLSTASFGIPKRNQAGRIPV